MLECYRTKWKTKERMAQTTKEYQGKDVGCLGTASHDPFNFLTQL